MNGTDVSRNLLVGLVACSSQKLQRPAPARELYVSALFTKASAYVEQSCDSWYVLSAKHGLVQTILEPYDMRLDNRRVSPSIQSWAGTVRKQITDELDGMGDVTLIALAGKQYRSALLGSLWSVEVPMEGLGIGQQLTWLNGKLAACKQDHSRRGETNRSKPELGAPHDDVHL